MFDRRSERWQKLVKRRFMPARAPSRNWRMCQLHDTAQWNARSKTGRSISRQINFQIRTPRSCLLDMLYHSYVLFSSPLCPLHLSFSAPRGTPLDPLTPLLFSLPFHLAVLSSFFATMERAPCNNLMRSSIAYYRTPEALMTRTV